MKTTEDKRRNLEVDSIDRTQPVQFHQGWRYVVRPPEIEDRSCRRIDDIISYMIVDNFDIIVAVWLRFIVLILISVTSNITLFIIYVSFFVISVTQSRCCPIFLITVAVIKNIIVN